MPGAPIRGVIKSIDAGENLLVLEHGDVSGMLTAAATTFKVEPSLLQNLKSGAEILGRVEKREGVWCLFYVRVLVRINSPAGSNSPTP
jgi:Cu/Ag efflux protein CusF